MSGPIVTVIGPIGEPFEAVKSVQPDHESFQAAGPPLRHDYGN